MASAHQDSSKKQQVLNERKEKLRTKLSEEKKVYQKELEAKGLSFEYRVL